MLKETVESYKKMYTEKKNTIEWMISFGNEFERNVGSIIKKVALENQRWSGLRIRHKEK